MTFQGQQPPIPAPPRRRQRRNGLLIAGAVIVGLIAAVAIGHAASAAHTVTLTVHGGGTMDVAYRVGNKDSQDTSATSPWQATYHITGEFPYASITAQNGGSGSISCTITEDGNVVSSNTSNGAYSVVQCSH